MYYYHGTDLLKQNSQILQKCFGLSILSELNNRETIAAIEANNDTIVSPKRIEKFPLILLINWWEFCPLNVFCGDCCCSILGWHIVGVLSTYDEARLTKHLLDNYERNGSKYARPVNKYDDVPEVLHGLALQSIDIIDPYSDRMVLNVWEYFVSKP